MTAAAGPNRPPAGSALPAVRSLLAVCAHPDDESFGLGAVLSAFADAGTRTSLLCFTHGEASTLHGVPGGLHRIRAEELTAAAEILAVGHAELLDYPDGGLAAQPLHQLAAHVRRAARAVAASTLLVFDHGGVTGHPDHHQATQAALAAADLEHLPVLAWRSPTPSPPRSTPPSAPASSDAPPTRSTRPSASTATASTPRSPVTPARRPAARCCGGAWSCSAIPSTCGGCAGGRSEPAATSAPRRQAAPQGRRGRCEHAVAATLPADSRPAWVALLGRARLAWVLACWRRDPCDADLRLLAGSQVPGPLGGPRSLGTIASPAQLRLALSSSPGEENPGREGTNSDSRRGCMASRPPRRPWRYAPTGRRGRTSL